ncbi:MAG: DUF2264 domain-containing protein, partial [Micromonosporaceae bacterium]|nr:DUF2264 domain-containing protein [Micromonosporaceae bacterium]
GAGSPYWACKGFAGLVLPHDHPVWTATEEQLPLESREVALALPAPGWLISGTRADGIVRVVNHGTDHQDDQRPTADDPGYARYAFSTHAGPEYGVQAGNSPVDNHIALIDEAGAVSHRSAIVPLGVKHAPGSGSLVGMSRHRARWLVEPLAAPNVWPPAPVNLRAGPIVTTASVLRGAIEVRIARVDADASPGAGAGAVAGGAAAGAVAGGGAVGAGYGPWTLRFGGFALADATPPESLIVNSLAVARRADGLTSGISGLRGLEAAAVCPERGGNAFGRCSAVPTVSTRGPVTPGEVVAAAVIITGDPAISVETIPGLLPAITVTTADGGGEMVVIRWPDGSTDQVSLPL